MTYLLTCLGQVSGGPGEVCGLLPTQTRLCAHTHHAYTCMHTHAMHTHAYRPDCAHTHTMHTHACTHAPCIHMHIDQTVRTPAARELRQQLGLYLRAIGMTCTHTPCIHMHTHACRPDCAHAVAKRAHQLVSYLPTYLLA